MSPKYEITFDSGLLYIKLLKKLDLESVQLLIMKIANEYDYRFRLWDLSAFSEDFTLNELRNYAAVGDQILTNSSAIALYTPSDRLYGEMRQYAAIRGHSETTILNTFRDFDEAQQWLLGQRDKIISHSD